MKQKYFAVYGFVIGLICILLGIWIGYSVTPTQPIWITAGNYPGAPAFTIWREGSYYYAKNVYGDIPYSGGIASTVIQNAINALTTGGTIQFSGDIFQLTAPLTLVSGVTLQGTGKGVTVLRMGNLSATTIIAQNIHQVCIRDLTLDKNSYFATGGDAIYLYNVSLFQYRTNAPPYTSRWLGYGAYIENVLILNQMNGIHVTNCKWVYIEDVDIFNIGSNTTEGTGILIDRDTDFYLKRVWLAHHYYLIGGSEVSTNATGIGIKIIGGSGLYFEDINVVGLYWTKGIYVLAESGVKIWWGFMDHVMCDTIGGNAWEFSADATSEIKGFVLVNCWGASSEQNGFYLYGNMSAQNTTIYGFRFSSCRSISNGHNGFLLAHTVADIAFSNCEIADNNQNESAITGDGIQLVNVTGNVKVNDCRIGNYLWNTKTQRYGVYIGANCDNYHLTDNILTNNTDGAVYDGSASTSVNVTYHANVGYRTRNSGNSTGTGAEQTIAHGLAVTPNLILLSPGYANATQTTVADATNIYITANITAYYWYVEYRPGGN